VTLLLISRAVSSLVILMQAGRGGKRCHCMLLLRFRGPGGATPTAILGSVLKQVVGGRHKIPESIVKAFRDQGKVVDRRGGSAL